MDLLIRQEEKNDTTTVETVIQQAFENTEYSDGDEQNLVARLRKSASFIPALSLVAEMDKEIIGHILFTKIFIEDEKNRSESLALAPVSVLPEHQNMGIGSILIEEGFKLAKMLGYTSVIVLGHPSYYPRFGFVPAERFGIKAPFDVPSDVLMAAELEKGSLHKVSGTVVYPDEFNL